MSQNNLKSPNMDDNPQADELKDGRGDKSVISPVEPMILHDVPAAPLAERAPREEVGYQDRKKKRLVCCIQLCWLSV